MPTPVTDLGRAALVVVDMQNDFLHADGVFGRSAAAQERPIDFAFLAGTIPHARRLIEGFRRAGRPVVYIAHVLKADYSDAAFPHRMEGEMKNKQFIVEGSWGAEIVDDLAPQAGEHRVVKKGFGGFDHTELDLVLHNLGVDTCVVCGVTTCVCVSTTARGAVARNYRLVIARDAVAEVDRETHEAELRTMARAFGDVRPTDEILALLGTTAPAATGRAA